MLDKEEIEQTLNKIITDGQRLEEEPTYELALSLDAQISVLKFIIGEQNFEAMHYFKRVHDKAIKVIDEHDKAMTEEMK